jgi:hypothetical protein
LYFIGQYISWFNEARNPRIIILSQQNKMHKTNICLFKKNVLSIILRQYASLLLILLYFKIYDL